MIDTLDRSHTCARVTCWKDASSITSSLTSDLLTSCWAPMPAPTRAYAGWKFTMFHTTKYNTMVSQPISFVGSAHHDPCHKSVKYGVISDKHSCCVHYNPINDLRRENRLQTKEVRTSNAPHNLGAIRRTLSPAHIEDTQTRIKKKRKSSAWVDFPWRPLR